MTKCNDFVSHFISTHESTDVAATKSIHLCTQGASNGNELPVPKEPCCKALTQDHVLSLHKAQNVFDLPKHVHAEVESLANFAG